MDEEYDVIVLGTGMKDTLLSGLMSVAGKKVLHMDRNGYYGGESASLSLDEMFKKYANGEKPPPELGSSRDYNIDLIPKFMMASGKLVKMLLHTKTTHYLEFKQIDGSFVVKKGEVHKVPATETEALKSGLMGLFEKRRFRNFLVYVQDYEEANPATHKGRDLKRITGAALFKDFGLQEETIDFVGHALALHTTDAYLREPALNLVKRCQLYSLSLAQYGKSPYIYPLYGLGELPQAFSRMSAVHGGVYMLNKPVDKIEYDANGRVCGVTSEGETAKCKMVIGDPSYFLADGKVKQVGQVIRMVCILSHPVPNTNNSDSCQIIIPQNQVGRSHDIYITCLGNSNCVAPAGKYVVIVSSTVETADPVKEVTPALRLLGKPDKIFALLNNIYEPINDPTKDGCFISTSFDATSHFETSVNDVLAIYEKIMATLPPEERKEIDLEKPWRGEDDS
eukprot:CAMPEP_0206047050 /NCGR_PEP_ID=MMETSP1466-20131121/20186_1 /ASSEMBLY_ACC=CAM_ASM_001126 /TAXON_ID=44452 /ORGANISM="Pavlova gyrans, Strain CCMP608" /LENGTH=450 /DNA_ID=CAMNT_0053422055 /DNA_START=55 /DNA_END=1407 /DNA_ORIENTATION=+